MLTIQGTYKGKGLHGSQYPYICTFQFHIYSLGVYCKIILEERCNLVYSEVMSIVIKENIQKRTGTYRTYKLPFFCNKTWTDM